MPDVADESAAKYDIYVNALLLINQKKVIEMHTWPTPNEEDRFCVDCGEKIPESRINVVPGARRCVRCQEIEDQRRSWKWR